jgi:hypothetical protein
MGWVGLRFEFGQAVLCEYDANGVLKTQPDGAGVSPQVASYDTMWPLGFAARAPAATAGKDGKPIGGGGCNLLIGKDGSEFRVQLMGDYRDLAKIPPLPVEGGSVQYAPGGAVPSFHVISAKDGTQQIYVEVGDSAHVITVGLDGNGEAVLELTHARGMALTFFKDAAVLKNRTGAVYVELNDDGGTLNGNWKVTGAFDIGAGSVPLVKAPPLATELAALQTALTLVGTALTAISGVPIVAPAGAAPSAAAVAAIVAAQAALAAFGAAGPTIVTKGT